MEFTTEELNALEHGLDIVVALGVTWTKRLLKEEQVAFAKSARAKVRGELERRETELEREAE